MQYWWEENGYRHKVSPVSGARIVSASGILAVHEAQLPSTACTYMNAKLLESCASKGKWMCHRFSPKLGQAGHRFSVGLKGWCPQHSSPNHF